MHECAANHPVLPALFDPAVPDNPVLWAVLKGRHTGKALVDHLLNPSQCVLRTDAALTFFGRQTTQTFINQAVAYYRRTDSVWLIWPPTISSMLLEPEAGLSISRLEYYDYDPYSDAFTNLRRRLPDGFEIHPIDRPLLERCEWRSDMEFYCGSIDNFLTNGMGLCLRDGNEIIVEAYVSSFGDATAEIGAVTHEAYRGQGYAPLACAYLIEACEQRGYKAYWSCDADNQASIRVARKLGFRQEKAYMVLEYNPMDHPITG